MELKKDVCPRCGCEETMEGKQVAEGSVFPREAVFVLMKRSALIHVICRKCGTVIRSYVEYPGNLV